MTEDDKHDEQHVTLDEIAMLYLEKIHVEERKYSNADMAAAYHIAIFDLIGNQLHDLTEVLRGIKKQLTLEEEDDDD